MEAESEKFEEKCENLMNIVVESRKTYGKICVDYEDKILIMERKLLNWRLKSISNYKFKPKNPVKNINTGNMQQDIENFNVEILEKQKRIEDLKRNLKNTQAVVLQLQKDTLGKLLLKPLTAEAMLAQAKSKIKS